MLTITVQDVLTEDARHKEVDPTFEPYMAYVIRDGNAVLYVGRSYDLFNRLYAHFGRSWRGSNSSFGLFL